MARLRSRTGTYDQGIIASSSAPSAAFVGQIWFNNATGVVYQWTTDGASNFWLDISSGGIGTSAERGVDFVGDTDPHLETSTTGAGLAVGSVYYNREKNRYFVCTNTTTNGNQWAGRFAGSGGVETTYKSGSDFFRVHVFLNSETFIMKDAMNVDYLVIAGGGGAGEGYYGCGGGAGGMRTAAGFAVTAQDYGITVGAGGIKGTGQNSIGASGGNSIFSTITSTGGGGGASRTYTSAGGAGGSGGGSNYQAPGAGGTGINDGGTFGTATFQGFAGGTGGSNKYGAGGGGAGAVGVPGGAGSGYGQAGGVGRNQIMGLSASNTHALCQAVGIGVVASGTTWFAGGGSGGNSVSQKSAGGGGGTGGLRNGGNGTAGTGGGGGGGAESNDFGAEGGSGIVVIRYQINA